MSPELLQAVVNLGGFGFAIWMLNNVWSELKVSNERIYQLLIDREKAAAERDEIKQQLAALAENSSSPS